MLKASYRKSEEAADKLPRALIGFYRQSYPTLYSRRSQDINQAAQAALAIYNLNVFPDLKVPWAPTRTTWAILTLQDVSAVMMARTQSEVTRQSLRTAVVATNYWRQTKHPQTF
ncbi:MAG: hypothetical protein ACJ746_12535 [Bryobacteraceae bacterium]